MDLILAAAIYLTCPSAQEVIGRLVADENMPARQKEELIEVILEHVPINCEIPQAV